jgi:hypothetical protein
MAFSIFAMLFDGDSSVGEVNSLRMPTVPSHTRHDGTTMDMDNTDLYQRPTSGARKSMWDEEFRATITTTHGLHIKA